MRMRAFLVVCVVGCGERASPGENATGVISGNIEESTTWALASCPLTLEGDVFVGGTRNPVLTIEAGCTVKMNPGASLRVGRNGQGGLKAVGTIDRRIVFTSNAATAKAGDWKGVFLTSTADPGNTRLENVDIVGAGDVDTKGALNVDVVSVDIRNTTITGSLGYGIVFSGASSFGEGSYAVTVKGAAKAAVSIDFEKVGSVPSASSSYTDNTVPGVEIRSGSLEETQTLRNIGAPWIASGALYIGSSASPVLSIEPGTRIAFERNASLTVGARAPGSLRTLGDDSAPVTFTSRSTTKTKGDWEGVFFLDSAGGQSRLQNTVIDSAGKTATSAGLTIDGATPVLVNTSVRNGKGAGIALLGTGALGAGSMGVVVNQNDGAGVTVHDGNAVGTLPQVESNYSGNGGPGVLIDEDARVTKDATWNALGTPYVLKGLLSVEGMNGTSAVLTLNAGAVLGFSSLGELSVGYGGSAALRALGSSAATVQLTSSAATPTAGAWKGVRFYENAIPGTDSNRGSRLDYTTVVYAGQNDAAIVIREKADLPKFSQSTVSSFATYGACVKDAPTFTISGLSISGDTAFCP